MKKVLLFGTFAVGLLLAACGGKKADADKTAADSAAMAAPDTIVMDYGTVEVDSVAPDSVQVAVTDTTVEMVAEPNKVEKK
ncbi:MAG: hypothetical protein RR202_00715 [Bacteroidales bacterium]